MLHSGLILDTHHWQAVGLCWWCLLQAVQHCVAGMFDIGCKALAGCSARVGVQCGMNCVVMTKFALQSFEAGGFLNDAFDHLFLQVSKIGFMVLDPLPHLPRFCKLLCIIACAS